jgi:hypothetical protein
LCICMHSAHPVSTSPLEAQPRDLLLLRERAPAVLPKNNAGPCRLPPPPLRPAPIQPYNPLLRVYNTTVSSVRPSSSEGRPLCRSIVKRPANHQASGHRALPGPPRLHRAPAVGSGVRVPQIFGRQYFIIFHSKRPGVSGGRLVDRQIGDDPPQSPQPSSYGWLSR